MRSKSKNLQINAYNKKVERIVKKAVKKAELILKKEKKTFSFSSI